MSAGKVRQKERDFSCLSGYRCLLYVKSFLTWQKADPVFGNISEKYIASVRTGMRSGDFYGVCVLCLSCGNSVFPSFSVINKTQGEGACAPSLPCIRSEIDQQQTETAQRSSGSSLSFVQSITGVSARADISYVMGIRICII